MTDTVETGFDYYGDDEKAWFSSSEKKWIKKVNGLMKKFPGEVEVIRSPEENDGCLYARLPKSWLRISPPRKIEISDEERERRRAQAAIAVKSRKN